MSASETISNSLGLVNRARRKTWREFQAAPTIASIVKDLKLPDMIAREALSIHRKAVETGIATNRSIYGIVAVSVYMACRRAKIFKTIQEVSKASGAWDRDVARYYRIFTFEMNDNDPVLYWPTVKDYVLRLLTNTDSFSPKTQELAIKIADLAEKDENLEGKSRAGIAAACILLASNSFDEKSISQKEIATLAEITPGVIRVRCNEIMDNPAIKENLGYYAVKG